MKKKEHLVKNRKPRKQSEFPAREHTGNCRPDRKMNRCCNPEWFDTYKFLAYSEQEDGVYCLSCIPFQTQPKSGSWAAKFMRTYTTSYTNWRKATDYLFSHADEYEYHKTSYNRFDAFLNTQNNPSICIDQRMTSSASKTVERNRRFLKSILRVLEYLGHQGLDLQGRRYDRAALGDNVINESKKYMNHVTHPLTSADIGIFSTEISNFYYIK